MVPPKRPAILSACFLLVAAARLADAATVPQPAIALDGSTVVVTSITPGATVFVYGFAREPRGWWNQLVRRATILTDGGSGRVSWTIDEPVPLRSVWFAVDLSTGLYGVGSMTGYPATQFELSDQHLKKDATGAVTKLALDGANVEFVVVRPGQGAWANSAIVNSPLDDANTPGSVTMSIANLQPVGGTTKAAPTKLAKGDVVFIFDSWRAVYGIVAVKE